MARVETHDLRESAVQKEAAQALWDAVLKPKILNGTGANDPGVSGAGGKPGVFAVIDGGQVKTPGGDNPDPVTGDDWWLSLTGEGDAKTLHALQEIYDHWEEWGFHSGGLTFKFPADGSVNPNAKGFVEWLAQNPSVLEAWQKYSGAPDGKLTKAGLDKFMRQYEGDLQDAYVSYNNWLQSNPAATDAEKKEAQQLAMVWANRLIIGEGSDYLTPEMLANFGARNPNFSPAVIEATKTWSDPAHFADVDNAGWSYGESKPDGMFDGNNASAWFQHNRAITAEDTTIWGSLAPDDAERNSLAQPLLVSDEFFNHWDQWGFEQGVKLTSPAPEGSDPAAKAFIEFAGKNPALVAAWDKNHDGTITKAELGEFIMSTEADVRSAEAAYKDYLAKNPNADPASKELAREAALVAANRYLIGNGNPYLSSQQLADFAKGASANPGIDPDIFNAAKFMSNPGVLRQFDNAGDNPALVGFDGNLGVNNVVQWLAKSAPKDASEFAIFLNSAATSSLVSGVDTSGLGPDVFVHPESYDGKTKAAVLQQLMDAYTKLQAGIGSQYWDPYGRGGLNGNKDKVAADLEAKISLLSGDKDVQEFLVNERPKALQDIVNSSPELKAKLTDYYDKTFAAGGGFSEILGTKDANGNPISLGDAVKTFVVTGQILFSALGREGSPDLLGTLKNSGHYDEVKQYYLDNLVTGKSLKDALAGGQDVGAALSDFYANVAAFNSVLDPKLVDDNVAALDGATMDIVADKLFGDGSAEDIKAAFGDANGNLDEAKLLQILQEAEAADPDLFKDANGSRITPDQIVAAFRGVFDDVRQGAKITDALNKLKLIGKADNGVMAAYNKGVFHIVSALFMGGILGARAGAGGTTPGAQASKIAAGFQLAGLLLEGTSKYTKSIDPANRFGNWLNNANLAKIESYGKILGGVGGILGGGFSIASGVNALKQGDKVGAGISFTGGLLGILSGLTGGGEALASLFGSGLAAGLGLASGVLGLIGGFFAFGALAGLSIYEVFKHAEEQNRFYGNFLPVMQQYGINGGAMTDSDRPVEGGAP